mmetsp:Transcript_30682/g.98887  ORF Transcript_30682/g.98887 Transcript_30682/m.98887 type:complete len:271 (+) Transcript_30682:639-1451(+)
MAMVESTCRGGPVLRRLHRVRRDHGRPRTEPSRVVGRAVLWARGPRRDGLWPLRHRAHPRPPQARRPRVRPGDGALRRVILALPPALRPRRSPLRLGAGQGRHGGFRGLGPRLALRLLPPLRRRPRPFCRPLDVRRSLLPRPSPHGGPPLRVRQLPRALRPRTPHHPRRRRPLPLLGLAEPLHEPRPLQPPATLRPPRPRRKTIPVPPALQRRTDPPRRLRHHGPPRLLPTPLAPRRPPAPPPPSHKTPPTKPQQTLPTRTIIKLPGFFE